MFQTLQNVYNKWKLTYASNAIMLQDGKCLIKYHIIVLFLFWGNLHNVLIVFISLGLSVRKIEWLCDAMKLLAYTEVII